MILVGTCGFQYRDWVKVFYPVTLGPEAWLDYYGRNFGCCEIGFTSLRMPEPGNIQQLADESRGRLQFIFRVPARLQEEVDDSERARQFRSALWPLSDSGQLSGLLAQFPPGFQFTRENFERLCRLRDLFEGIPLIAEFGNADWNSPRAAKHLASARIALACVDGGASLKEKPFLCATAGQAYVRFQGRNQSRWLKGDGSAQHDYLYSRAELAAFVPELKRLEQESDRVFVLMNNPWRGQAVINARTLIELLRG